METIITNNFNTEGFTTLKYKTKLHWISHIPSFVLMAIGFMGIPIAVFSFIRLVDQGQGADMVLVVSILVSFLFFKGLLRYLYNRTIKVLLYENKLTLKAGLFTNSVVDISLNKLEGLSLHQNLLGRYLNYGTLFITTGGISQSYQIANPNELRNKLYNH